MVKEIILRELYIDKKQSIKEIANLLGCSSNQVRYWMLKYDIHSRTHSEATYVKRNPNGDPFHFRRPITAEEYTLFGVGIGLYWGEGTKADLNSVRLGNTNPLIIGKFMDFLTTFFEIEVEDLKFGLQLFSDIDIDLALDFWTKQLNIEVGQINKPVITKSGAIGTYRQKSQYGVMTVMYHNKKLRDLLISLLPM
jgi:hypothetical protein